MPDKKRGGPLAQNEVMTTPSKHLCCSIYISHVPSKAVYNFLGKRKKGFGRACNNFAIGFHGQPKDGLSQSPALALPLGVFTFPGRNGIALLHACAYTSQIYGSFRRYCLLGSKSDFAHISLLWNEFIVLQYHVCS